jgi:hypothetical protein
VDRSRGDQQLNVALDDAALSKRRFEIGEAPRDFGRDRQDRDVRQLVLDRADVLGAALGALGAVEKLTEDERARDDLRRSQMLR